MKKILITLLLTLNANLLFAHPNSDSEIRMIPKDSKFILKKQIMIDSNTESTLLTDSHHERCTLRHNISQYNRYIRKGEVLFMKSVSVERSNVFDLNYYNFKFKLESTGSQIDIFCKLFQNPSGVTTIGDLKQEIEEYFLIEFSAPKQF